MKFLEQHAKPGPNGSIQDSRDIYKILENMNINVD